MALRDWNFPSLRWVLPVSGSVDFQPNRFTTAEVASVQQRRMGQIGKTREIYHSEQYQIIQFGLNPRRAAQVELRSDQGETIIRRFQASSWVNAKP